MSANTRYEAVRGLHVTDDEMYARYREAMMPLLEASGGMFRYDFRVSEVLKNQEGRPINRVFVISFPSREVHDAFFANAEYKAVRAKFYDGAVGAATTIASFVREVDG